MTEGGERAVTAVSVPMSSGGTGMSPSMGVAAPIGAVSRKDRQRAGRTSLHREGTSLLLRTALPGRVSLQRRADDGSWETVVRRPASRLGRTRLELPGDATASAGTFRVVFAPRNPNLTAWISPDVVV